MPPRKKRKIKTRCGTYDLTRVDVSRYSDSDGTVRRGKVKVAEISEAVDGWDVRPYVKGRLFHVMNVKSYRSVKAAVEAICHHSDR